MEAQERFAEDRLARHLSVGCMGAEVDIVALAAAAVKDPQYLENLGAVEGIDRNRKARRRRRDNARARGDTAVACNHPVGVGETELVAIEVAMFGKTLGTSADMQVSFVACSLKVFSTMAV